MNIYTVLGIIVVNNLAWLWMSDRAAKRSAKQVDSLTTKIIAPHTVSACEPADTKLPPGGITITQNEVPIADADPEAIMHALEVEAGRAER